MLKILFIVPYLSSGGAERVVSILSSELKKLGIDSQILTFYRVKNEYEVSKEVKLFSLRNNKEEYKKMLNISKVLEIRNFIKTNKFDIVIPFIEYVGMIANIARIGLPVKFIETVRNNPKKFPNTKKMRCLRNISILLSDLCIVQNEEQKRYFSNIIRNKCKVLNNPINNEFIINKKEFKKNDIRKIIAVGRLEEQKNHLLLLKAIKDIISKYNYIELEIYGEGSLYNELRNYVLKNGLESNVKICDRTDRIIDKLLESDLFILTSNQEGMPNSLMEAMALGIPCISTDCPHGPADIIKNNFDGILIPVNDKRKLINTINDAIVNPHKYIEMSKRARCKMIEKYTADRITNNLIEIINNI